MADQAEIEQLIDSLEDLASEIEGRGGKWKDVWDEIRRTGQAFKGSSFPSAEDREAAWNRFQSVIGRVKESQQNARDMFEERVRESEEHLEHILSCAERATPSSAMDDLILTIATAGLNIVITEGINAILGPFDERKMELQRCNEAMREGWAHLSRNKAVMLGKHKQEAFQALKRASDSLTAEWDSWRGQRQEAIERFRAEKHAAWEERKAKREAWEMRIRENISKLEDRLDRLESALDHRQSNLSKLEDMRSSAWSDDFRERVDGWISDEEERINDIERKIEQIKGWISDAESKLR